MEITQEQWDKLVNQVNGFQAQIEELKTENTNLQQRMENMKQSLLSGRQSLMTSKRQLIPWQQHRVRSRKRLSLRLQVIRQLDSTQFKTSMCLNEGA